MTSSTRLHTLVQLIQARADSPHSIHFVKSQEDRSVVSFGQLYKESLACLSLLQQRDLEPGTELIIQVADNALFTRVFWACLLGGIVPVPVATGTSDAHRHKLFRIAEQLERPALFAEKAILQRLSDFATCNQMERAEKLLSNRTVTAGDLSESTAPAKIFEPEPSSRAFIQFSSGSTSDPKGIVLTHENLMVNMRAIIDGCQMGSNDSMLSWMPLTHDMGLIGFHLTPMLCDSPHCLMQTDRFIRRPSAWLTEACTQNSTLLCSPNFGYQHVLKSFSAKSYPALDLSHVRLIFNGAEPISDALCQQFLETFQPYALSSDAMYPVYGLAEASLAVTFPSLQQRYSTIRLDRGCLGVGQRVKPVDQQCDGAVFVCVGYPINEVQVRIADDSGVSLDSEHVGHVLIRGRNVTAGYYNAPEITAELIDSNGWLKTGDLGFFKDQQLFITGRSKDLIFVNGQNVYPHDLEEILVRAGVVERGKIAIASLPECENRGSSKEQQIVAFVQHRSSDERFNEIVSGISSSLSKEAGVSVHHIVAVPRIPKTTSGKVQRYLLVEALLGGEYQHVLNPLMGHASCPSEESTELSDLSLPRCTAPPESNGDKPDDNRTRLLAICQAHVQDQTVTVDDNLFELGISSLTLAQIHADIEEQWPDRIDITDLFDYPSVAGLAEFLDRDQ